MPEQGGLLDGQIKAGTHWMGGPLMGGGGPDVACHFFEMAMSHVSVAYFPPCHMSKFKQ